MNWRPVKDWFLMVGLMAAVFLMICGLFAAGITVVYYLLKLFGVA